MLFAKIINAIRPQQMMEVRGGAAEGREEIFGLGDCSLQRQRSSMLVPSEWQACRKGKCNLEERANRIRVQAWFEMAKAL
jgi:hypothetical protein